MKFSVKVSWSLNYVSLHILWTSKHYKNPPSERNGRKKVRQRVFSPSFIYYSENLKALGKSDNIKYHVTHFASNLCVHFQPTFVSFKLFKSSEPQSALKAFLPLLQSISFNMAFWTTSVGYSDWKSVKPNINRELQLGSRCTTQLSKDLNKMYCMEMHIDTAIRSNPEFLLRW